MAARRPFGGAHLGFQPGLVLLLAVQASLLWWQLRDHAFVFDDLLYEILGRSTSSRWAWLTSDYFQHVAPLHRLWWNGQQHLGPLEYRWALAAGVVGILIGTALFKHALDVLFGVRRIHLWLTAMVAFSVLWLRPLQWWSAGLQVVPTFICSMIMLIAYARWLDGRRRSWLVVGGAAMAGGLLFYEMPIGIFAAVVLLRLLLLNDDLTPKAILRVLRDERAALVAFGAPAVVFLAWYVVGVDTAQPVEPVGVAVLGDFFSRTWLHTLTPSLFGAVIRPDRYATEQLVVVLSQAAFWGTVAWTLWRRRSDAVRVWAWFGVVVVVKLAIVGFSRLPHFDAATVADDPRYVAEFAFLWPLALGAALREPGAGVAGRLRGERAGPPPATASRRVRSGAVILVVAAYVAVGLHSNAGVIERWPGEHARRYQHNVEGLLRSLPPGGIVADGPVPHFVVPIFATPYNTVGRLLPLFELPVQVDGPERGGGVFMVAPDGTGTEVEFVGRGGGAALDEFRRGSLRTDDAVATEDAVCLGSTDGGPHAFTLDLPEAIVLPDPYVRMTYSTDASYTIEVRIDTGSGPSAYPTTGLTVAEDAGASVAWLRSPDVDDVRALRFDVPAHQRLCIERIEVGDLVTGR